MCCRKVAAVNQVGGESCINLLFISPLLERTNTGILTTGSTTRASAVASRIPAHLQTLNKKGNSYMDSSREQHGTMGLSFILCFRSSSEHSQPENERMLLVLRAHNKTRQIKQRLRDTSCSTEVHSLKVMHCKTAFLLGGTFILCDGCRLTVSAHRLGLGCVRVTCSC